MRNMRTVLEDGPRLRDLAARQMDAFNRTRYENLRDEAEKENRKRFGKQRNVIHLGEALDVFQMLPDNSVQCMVTSPPYWGLRDYGTGKWQGGDPKCEHKLPWQRRSKPGDLQHTNRGTTCRPLTTCGKCGAIKVDRQLGLEPTVQEYIERVVVIFREARRVLRPDGTLWLNMGDLWAHEGTTNLGKHTGICYAKEAQDGRKRNPANDRRMNETIPAVKRNLSGFKKKDMVGLPWMVAFALREDGWYLRDDIIWDKKNPMPESVRDRCTRSHEYIFLLTKKAKYFYDAEAIKEPVNGTAHPRGDGVNPKAAKVPGPGSRIHQEHDVEHSNRAIKQNRSFSAAVNSLVVDRNKRDVWHVATQACPEAHFATFPPDLIIPCIMAGTSNFGACSKCGAPYKRILKKQPSTMNIRVRDAKKGRLAAKSGISGLYTATDEEIENYGPEYVGSAETIGWETTCKCKSPGLPVRCIVYDPFMGRGTTAIVAKRLGRDYLGSELNPDYHKMAVRNIEAEAENLF